MSSGKAIRTLVALLLFAAASAAIAQSAPSMKILSCGAKASGGTIVFTLEYLPSAKLPDSLLLIVGIESEKGEDALLLNYTKDTDLTAVPSSGQVLFGTRGYAQPKKGTITFKLAERAQGIYDVTGLKGSIKVAVKDEEKKDGPALGTFDAKDCLF